MSWHFPLPLRGEVLDNGWTFLLLEPFVYRDRKINGEFTDEEHPQADTVEITVPADFVTDFNSVPPGFWNIFPKWEYPEAGVVHDYLYRFRPDGMSREAADQIHRRILEIKGCPAWKQWTAYSMLRAWGWIAWRRGGEFVTRLP